MDYSIIMQILIAIGLVVGIVYISRKLSAGGKVNTEDLNLAIAINIFIEKNMITSPVAKKVLQIIGSVTEYIEINMKNLGNIEKEDAAFDLVTKTLIAAGIDNPLEEEELRRVIRLSVEFMERTNPQNKIKIEI